MKSDLNTQILTRMLINESPQRKKAELLNSYLQIVVKEGFEAATLTRIAKENNTSKALVSYHLPKLENTALEIFTLCSKHAVEYTLHFLEKSSDSKEKVNLLIKAPFHWFFENLDIARFVILMYQKSSVDKKIRELHRKNIEIGRKRLAEALSLGLTLSAKEAEKRAHVIHTHTVATLILMHSTSDIHKDSPHITSYEYLIGKILEINLKIFS